MFCTNCGTEIKEGMIFCPQCGTDSREVLAKAIASQQAEEASQEEPPKSEAEKKRQKLGVLVGLGALVVVIVGVMFLGGRLGKASKPYVLYMKEGTLLSSNSGKKPVEISNQVYENEADARYSSATFDELVKHSQDQKYIFFPKAFNEGASSYDLYYTLNTKKPEPTKLASGVLQYTLTAENQVIYLDEDYNLYLHNLKDKSKIEGDVYSYYVSDDEKYIGWLSEDSKFYTKPLKGKAEKQKRASDVDAVLSYTEDFKQFIYVYDNTLYWVKGDDKKKIADQVMNWQVYKEGNTFKVLYILQKDDKSSSLMDFVKDDKASEDAQIVEPSIYDYQHYEWVDSFWGRSQQLITDEAYYEAVEAYNAKCERDYLRQSLKDAPFYWYDSEIFCYSTKTDKSELIKEGCMNGITYFVPDREKVAFIYASIDEKDKPSVALSTITDAWDFEQQLGEKCLAASQLYLRSETAEVPLKYSWDELDTFQIEADEARQKLYVMVGEGDENGSELRSISYASKTLGEDQEIDDDVVGLAFVKGHKIYYYKGDLNNCQGEFYVEGTLIDQDVWYAYTVGESETVIYFKDLDQEEQLATACLYKGKKAVEVAQEVYECMPLSEKQIFLLMDYDQEDGEGTLNYYNGKKLKEVDTEVARLVY